MFDRIICHPDIQSGKPCIKGTRVSVEFILELFASGASRERIVQNYPQLASDDVEQALRYAARFLQNDVVITAEVHR